VLSREEKRRTLMKLNQAEMLESFIHTKFLGQKRFSLEGGEALIPSLDAIIELAPELGVKELVMGMAHRGRLNVLCNILNKSHQEIFTEFPDLGITPVFFREFYYCKRCAGIASEKTCPHKEEDRLNFSGTKLRNMFLTGETPPKEFMRPEVAKTILEFGKPFVE